MKLFIFYLSKRIEDIVASYLHFRGIPGLLIFIGNFPLCWPVEVLPLLISSFLFFFQEMLLKRAADLVEALYGTPHNNQVRSSHLTLS